MEGDELLTGRERLIVALDVGSVDDALRIVDELPDVRCFKVGWRLLMAGLRSGGLDRLWREVTGGGRTVFVDLKVPDIGNTVASVVGDLADDPAVRFLTLHESLQGRDIAAAKAARGARETPYLLTVPFVSSLDAGDLAAIAPAEAARGMTLDQWILGRAESAIGHGCDGVIASGEAIALCRGRWPRDATPRVWIVSPGIRPAGSGTDDHKRSTTPAAAVAAGADYLVVGRPVLNAGDRARAAAAIVQEIDVALGDAR
ncbi:MAG: orotidine-5'-phosphate decarboxylase [Acidobacteria bacterium]|nr:orotidine-5'-phosphate decarboxylase [Acidobacteriota bacterium]